jgi:hypothetical protein
MICSRRGQRCCCWCRPCCSRCCCCCHCRRHCCCCCRWHRRCRNLLAAPLVRSPFLALALHLCPHARSLACWPPRSIIIAATSTPAAAAVGIAAARLPSCSLTGSLVRSLLLVLLLLLLPSLVLLLQLRLQLPLRVHPRSLSLVAHCLCASVLCSPCLLSVVQVPVKPRLAF